MSTNNILAEYNKEAEALLQKINCLEKELKEAKEAYSKVATKLKKLKQEKSTQENKEKIAAINQNIDSEWVDRKFQWSKSIKKLLKDKFAFDTFRSKQLAAINATLSNEDVLLVMPTGGGKSLVYQLPALYNSGFTLVVSPLISLIEDQLMSLKQINVNVAAINGNTPKDEVKATYKEMLDKKSLLKLLYVTPEWLAKSKLFMAQLKKCYEANRISRVAIDEVHCCSTWGHDFRPDYGYLGIVRTTLAKVPFIGLTATATLAVLTDVQSMLNMENAMIITAPFNRPNLFYKVEPKPTSKDEAKYLESLLLTEYKDQTGIIYASTVSDCMNLAEVLKKRGVKIAPYHAQMEAAVRKQIHTKWVQKKYQVIVATVAFGMGIDKPDVRFVIHHSMPRSMESLYQESGRAGRDGKKADCIVLFNLNDYLKILGNASSITDEKKALLILEYCIDRQSCRRAIIASHFEETWEANHCNKMCDNCSVEEPIKEYKYDITSTCDNIHKILNNAAEYEIKMTLNKFFDAWLQTGPKKLRVEGIKAPQITKYQSDCLLGFLLLKKYLAIDKGYNTYSTICYLIPGNPPEEVIEMASRLYYRGFARSKTGTKDGDDEYYQPPIKMKRIEKKD